MEAVSPTTVEKLRKLPWALGFNASNAIYAQLTFFGSVFVLYLNELGFNKTQIGILLSLLSFMVIASLFSMPLINRWGFKLTFLRCWEGRTVVTLGLLFSSWILLSFGVQAAFIFITIVTIGFSTLKALGLTSLFSWQKEFVPDQLRGKFAAYSNIAVSLASLAALVISGAVLNLAAGYNGYLFLFGLGILAGLFSIISATRIPGGAIEKSENSVKNLLAEVFRPMADRTFMLFLTGSALVAASIILLTSYLPLFMSDIVGFSAGDIVYLGVGALVGAILTGYFWGWAADRYGSQPVMLSGLILMAIQPLFFIFIASASISNFPFTLFIYFIGGFATIGWAVGSSRLLYNHIMPEINTANYGALYHSWIGVVSGLSALIGGLFLERYANFHYPVMGFELDGYIILFIAATLLSLAAILLMRKLRVAREIGIGQFAGLFYHGNPIMAVESMIRFRFAKDERSTVSITERLGQSHSPLTVNELLEALADPRFYVRFEALISIGRHGPDEQLNEALEEILLDSDPAMSVIAAWAMGRTQDNSLREPLRKALSSPYRSVRSHAARSLASIGDKDSIPLIASELGQETDFGLKVAYATSLGKLGDPDVIPELLKLLRKANFQTYRQELALSLARLLDSEAEFIQLMRGVHADPGTILSQNVSILTKKFAALSLDDEIIDLSNQCAETFANDDLNTGVVQLSVLAGKLPKDLLNPQHNAILREAILQMKANKNALEIPYPGHTHITTNIKYLRS